MTSSNLLAIKTCGQSVWLDYLSRSLIESGKLKELVQAEGICGVTTNPAIFEKSINGSSFYDSKIASLAKSGLNVEEIYRQLTLEDVSAAADVLQTVYESTDGVDGFVSLEVSPHLANDSEATVHEARMLWSALDRDNVMIKVPATKAGLIAINQLIADGINVNVTLLFGISRYKQVCEAYQSGLEDRLLANKPIDRVASVASFFLSRIDSLLDPLLEQKQAGQYQGKTALASARLAYDFYQQFFSSQRFKILSDRQGRPQRLLWASTSTKNPAYPDTLYVDSLVAANTVNTLPMETFDAFRDHGQPATELSVSTVQAQEIMDTLNRKNIDPDTVARQLEQEGIQKFIDPYDKLLAALAQKSREARND